MKKNIMKSLSASFAKEFNVDKIMRKSLSNKFKEFRSVLENLKSDSNLDEFIVRTFADRSDKIRSLKFNILNDDVVSSFIHMHLNRIFRSKQRFHELVVYDLLYKYYASLKARNSG